MSLTVTIQQFVRAFLKIVGETISGDFFG
jgi:hypothetical protein